MPTSRPTHLRWLCEWIIENQPKTILDIGSGFGSKGMLFREYTDIWNLRYKRKDWTTKIDAIEIFEDYIGELQRQIYDTIYQGDALQILENYKKLPDYELIYAGDILEHFTKEEGIKFIKLLRKKGDKVIIVTPIKVSDQGAILGNEHETHKSQWSKEDFIDAEVIETGNMYIILYTPWRIYYCEGMKFYGERAEKMLNMKRYDMVIDIEKPVFFEGLYFQEDYDAFYFHMGKKVVFWNGSDILRMLQNPEWIKVIKENPAKHLCSNEQEQKELKAVGINADVTPIFFGDIEKYQICFRPSKITKVYMNAHPEREEEYGVQNAIDAINKTEGIELHIYGIDGVSSIKVIYHGLIPEEDMDEQIKEYQGCLRLNDHDGMSQIVIKSILMGQYVISKKKLEGCMHANSEAELFYCLNELKTKTEPNNDRSIYLNILNNFNWKGG